VVRAVGVAVVRAVGVAVVRAVGVAVVRAVGVPGEPTGAAGGLPPFDHAGDVGPGRNPAVGTSLSLMSER
jgi:hypothetical protein